MQVKGFELRGYVFKVETIFNFEVNKLRKLVLCIGIILIFLTLNLTGCEELEKELEIKPDYITVAVNVAVRVRLYSSDNEWLLETPEGLPVSIEMQKSGGEILTFTDEVLFGLASAEGSFKLYKEQFIECTATVQGSYRDFNPLGPARAMLSWEDLYPACDFGETYTWGVKLLIEMTNSTIIIH